MRPIPDTVLGDNHPVVQLLEGHGHGLKGQHHTLPLQLLPSFQWGHRGSETGLEGGSEGCHYAVKGRVVEGLNGGVFSDQREVELAVTLLRLELLHFELRLNTNFRNWSFQCRCKRSQ